MSAAASSHVRRCPHRTAAALCTDPDRAGAPTIAWCADLLCQTKLSGISRHAERAAAMRGDARRQYLIAVQSIEGGASARLLREAIDT